MCINANVLNSDEYSICITYHMNVNINDQRRHLKVGTKFARRWEHRKSFLINFIYLYLRKCDFSKVARVYMLPKQIETLFRPVRGR